MNGELRILILEDRPADAELVMRELGKAGLQFAGKCVATEVAFLAQLRDHPPDLILADYSLPAYDGLSALAAARKERPEIPFIFVSGSMGRAVLHEEGLYRKGRRGSERRVSQDLLQRPEKDRFAERGHGTPLTSTFIGKYPHDTSLPKSVFESSKPDIREKER